MSRDILIFAGFISVFIAVIASRLLWMAVSEWKKSKTVPTVEVIVGIILVLLILLMIFSATIIP